MISDIEAHSFDGQIGTLDYMTVNPAFDKLVVDAGIWSGSNSDEADALVYWTHFGRELSYYIETTPWLSSDHES